MEPKDHLGEVIKQQDTFYEASMLNCDNGPAKKHLHLDLFEFSATKNETKRISGAPNLKNVYIFVRAILQFHSV